jgi:acyl carrier protein
MQNKNTETSVREILATKNYGTVMPSDFKNNDSLFLHGIIDSFGLFEFIQTLQKTFSLNLSTREMHPVNFESVETIVRFIESKLPNDGNE